MTDATAILDQVNIVAGDMRASRDFYRRLGMRFLEPADDAPEFHAGGELANDFALDLDSPLFAQVWNRAWAGRSDLAGRIVLGFHVQARDTVNETYADLTGAGYHGLHPPLTPSGARATPLSKIRTGSPSDS